MKTKAPKLTIVEMPLEDPEHLTDSDVVKIMEQWLTVATNPASIAFAKQILSEVKNNDTTSRRRKK